MAAFPVNKIPPGFLELDGSLKSIAVYPSLAEFLGTAFNQGNGSRQFPLAGIARRVPARLGPWARC
ncbi:phage tail protein [Pseudomonas sp. A4]|uniref:phage tail protein n=1 Tax=Pseudomonas sp. S11A4 TaxID=1476791 RepID=UPI00215D5818|nr:phage tail protein [Pseudomonas sp. S11A4]MCR8935720.1 phage tail protein [Pseudomonas sp. S11A4]